MDDEYDDHDEDRIEPEEETLPFAVGSETSKAASLGGAKDRARNTRVRIYRYVESCGEEGATRDQIEIMLNLPHQTMTPRVLELERMICLKYDGIKRPTRLGNMAEVLKSVPGANPYGKPPKDDPVNKTVQRAADQIINGRVTYEGFVKLLRIALGKPESVG